MPRLGVLCVLAAVAVAEKKPLALEQAAQKVIAAIEAKDPAALKALAGRDRPDPWLVADLLCAQGKHDEAIAFAKAAPRRDVEKLPAYVEAQRGLPAEKEGRRTLGDASRALAEKNYAAVLDALAKAPAPIASVVSVRLHVARGLALLQRRPGDAAKAYLAAAHLAERLGWLSRLGTSLHGAGLGAVYAGKRSYAVSLWKRRLAVERNRGNRMGEARALSAIGTAHMQIGNYAVSLDYLQRALALQRESRDPSGTGGTLINIGGVHYYLGDYARAISCLEQGIERAKASGKRLWVALGYKTLSSVHLRFRDRDESLRLLEQARKIMEEIHALGDLAGILHSIGTIHHGLGNYRTAVDYYRRSFRLAQKTGRSSLALSTLVSLGSLRRDLGKHALALQGFELARNMATKRGERALFVRLLAGTARTYELMGKLDDARRFSKQALEAAGELGLAGVEMRMLAALAAYDIVNGEFAAAIRTARAGVAKLPLMAGGLGDEEGARARERWAGLFMSGTLAGRELNDASEVLFFMESGRAAGLLEALGGRQALARVAVPGALREQEAEARRVLRGARLQMGRAYKTGRRKTIRLARADLEKANEGVEKVAVRIQREAKATADVTYPQPASLEELRAALDESDALVIYGRVVKEAVALVVTRKEARIVPLGRLEAIEAAQRSLALHDPKADPKPALKTLRRLVVEPLALGAGTRRILVSPAGELAYVPFALLVPDHEIVHVPSGTTFARLKEAGKGRGEGVLALGDPDHGQKLAPLPGTRAEARAVGDVVLLGAKATEAGLNAALAMRPRWRAVHLACHGQIDPARPLLSSLALAPDPEHDGHLTTLEIFRLSIPADLVVLSACETGKGKVYRAEGIIGLTRAFMLAGAPRVIVSLWKVDDDATRALMVKFHQLWKAGAGAAAALRKAQEHVASQAQWTHPHYWAAWQLWGLAE